MNRKTILLATTLLIVATAGAANAATVKDNFNDNQTAAFWDVTTNKLDVREANKRLEFRSKKTGGGLRESGYVADDWIFDFTRNFTIKFKYHLDVNVTGNRVAFVGARAIPSGEYDEAYVFVMRDASGLSLLYESYIDGSLDTRREVPLSSTTGKIKIKYKKSADRLDVYVGNTRVMMIDGFLAGVDVGDGLADLSIGAARRGFTNWNWNDVWIDNFSIKGRIID